MIGFTMRVTGLNKVKHKIIDIEKQLPKALDRDAKRIARVYGMELTNSARSAGIRPFPKAARLGLYPSLKKIIRMKKGWGLNLPIHAFWLDSMGPHVVNWRKLANEPLRMWMESRNPGFTASYITVRPKPFIKEGLRKGSRHVRELFGKGESIKVIRKS